MATSTTSKILFAGGFTKRGSNFRISEGVLLRITESRISTEGDGHEHHLVIDAADLVVRIRDADDIKNLFPDHELEITRFLLQLGDRALVLEVVFYDMPKFVGAVGDQLLHREPRVEVDRERTVRIVHAKHGARAIWEAPINHKIVRALDQIFIHRS